MNKQQEHWEKVYQTKAPDAVSWFQEHATRSLEIIRSIGAASNAQIIDVGGGASTLVDDLLIGGFKHMSVLDLSASALEVARKRLGPPVPCKRMMGSGSSLGPWSRRCTFMPSMATNWEGCGAHRAVKSSTGRSGAHTATMPITKSATKASSRFRTILSIWFAYLFEDLGLSG